MKRQISQFQTVKAEFIGLKSVLIYRQLIKKQLHLSKLLFVIVRWQPYCKQKQQKREKFHSVLAIGGSHSVWLAVSRLGYAQFSQISRDVHAFAGSAAGSDAGVRAAGRHVYVGAA